MRRSKPRDTSSFNKSKLAVMYIRVSSQEQEQEGYSTDAQERLLNEYTRIHGYKIIKVYEDIETAKQSGRKEFGAMVRLLKERHDVVHIIAEKTDRIYRNFKDYVTIEELDVCLHLVKEQVILSKEAPSSDKLIHGIKVVMAKHYIDNLSEETRKGMLEKARQGMYPSRAPTGYVNIVSPSTRKKIIIPDPQLGSVIAMLFVAYRSGTKSLEDLRHLAYENGLRTRSGKSIGRSQIEYILKNEFYTGCFYWLETRYKGEHEALVSPTLFNEVQEQLRCRGQHRSHVQTRDHCYRGLLLCGNCGRMMTGEEQKGHIYYHCTGRSGSGCREPYAREDAIDEAYARALQRLRFDDDVCAWIKTALKQSKEDEKRYRQQHLERLRQESMKLQNRLDKVYDDKLDGIITTEEYQRRANQYRKDIDQATAQIDAHLKADQAYAELGVKILELAQTVGTTYLNQTSEQKRKMATLVFSNSIWKGRELEPSYRKPFDFIAVTAEKTKGLSVQKQVKNAGCPNWLPG